MTTFSHISPVNVPEFKRLFGSPDSVKTGDTLKGTVIQTTKAGKALIDFGRFRALVETQSPVKAGDELHVKVIEEGEQIKLASISRGEQRPSAKETIITRFEVLSEVDFAKLQTGLREILHVNESLPHDQRHPEDVLLALLKVQSHFQPMSLAGDVFQLMAQLKSTIEHSGFFFEKRIEAVIIELLRSSRKGRFGMLTKHPEINEILQTDLKPALYLLRAFLETLEREESEYQGDRQIRESMRDTMYRLINHIQDQQQSAVGRHLNSEPLQVFSYLLPIAEGHQRAKLKVYYPKKKKGSGKERFCVALLLAMDRIGEIRTDFYLLGKELSITFFVKDERVQRLFEDHFQEIQGVLQNWFEYLNLKAIVSEKKIAAFDTEDLNIDTGRLLDVRA